MLLEAATDLLGANWDKLSFLGACIVVIVILWRLVTKLAQEKDGASAKMVEFYKLRADEAAIIAKNYGDVVSSNTTAIMSLVKQIDLNNELLKDLTNELEKRNR